MQLGLMFCWLSSGLLAQEFHELSCEDFDKILSFVSTEHLRLHLASDDERRSLMREANRKLPERMIEDSFLMLGMDYERSGELRRIEQSLERRGVTELCSNFSHSVYRAYFLKSFVSELDPFSHFNLTEEFERSSSVLDGQFVGVGIGTRLEPTWIEVTEVLAGGPSDGKLQLGDRILSVDQRPVSRMSPRDVRQRIRGERGSMVRFELERAGNSLEVSVKRDLVQQHSLDADFTEEGILFLKVHRFYAQTPQEVRSLLSAHQKELKGIVLDLRDNPGGLLQAARDFVGLFTRPGVVVHLRGTMMRDELRSFAQAMNLHTPMVILTNERTASASEIVAGALQDYGRALVIGQPTFGKSSIQNIYDLQTSLQTQYKGQLKLTSLWYYLPSGRSVSLLQPDLLAGDSPTGHRAEMPFSWPERIQVPFFGNRFDASWISPNLSQTTDSQKLEELGQQLIRKMSATSEASL